MTVQRYEFSFIYDNYLVALHRDLSIYRDETS